MKEKQRNPSQTAKQQVGKAISPNEIIRQLIWLIKNMDIVTEIVKKAYVSLIIKNKKQLGTPREI